MRRIALVLLALAAGAHAQPTPEGPPDRMQRGGTFVEPPTSVDPAYIPLGPDKPSDVQAAQPRLALQLTLDLPLRTGGAGALTQGGPPHTPTLQALLRWRPLEDRAWFVQGAGYGYARPARQRSWDPDFTYAFGYDTGLVDRWAFVYANYTGTRWSPDAQRGERRWHFPQGQWTASYRFDLPATLRPLLLAGDGDAAGCHADANVVPTFTRQDGTFGSNKGSLALGCRYTRPEGWFAHLTGFAWPQAGKQQPWDPDYVYGFGWTQPGDPHGLTLQYVNYSGNRWPGRHRGAGEGDLRSGSVQLSWGSAW